MSSNKHSNEATAALLFQRTLIFIEVGLVFLTSLVVTVIRFESDLHRALFEFPGQPKILIYPLIWYFFLSNNGAWDKSLPFLSTRYYTTIINAGWKSLLIFSAVAFLLKYPISRIWVLANALAISTVLLLCRSILKRGLLGSIPPLEDRKYLVIGSPGESKEALEELRSLYGIDPKIFHISKPPSEISEFGEWLNSYRDKLLTENYFGVLIPAGSIDNPYLIKQIVNTGRDSYVELTLHNPSASIYRRMEILEIPVLMRISESKLNSGGSVLKRILDIVGSSIGLIALAPLFLFTAIAIKIDSKGPIFYVQKRVGLKGNVFDFPKFRSMKVGSDQLRLEILGRPDSEMLNRYKRDPRITRVGRFIRRWSIDELPQLWSVFKGEMSLVGPRPILPEEMIQVLQQEELRFLAKPGLTGLWQVSGRKEVAWRDRMLRDIAYIENWSIGKDLVLILKTINAIISGRGAY